MATRTPYNLTEDDVGNSYTPPTTQSQTKTLKTNTMAITPIESSSLTAVYNGKILTGTKVTDYETATIGDITKTLQTTGQVSDGSTTWTGEAQTTEDWLDEAGNVIKPVSKAATYGFDFELPSLTEVQMKRWLDAHVITHTFTEGQNYATDAKVFGFADVPTQIIPMGFLSDDGGISILFPKCSVSAGISFADKRFTIKVSVKAMSINNARLKTVMPLIGNAIVE